MNFNRPFRGFALFKPTFTWFRGPGGEGPRAEGRRGEVNLPPYRGAHTPDQGSADFWMHFGRPLAPFGFPFGSLWSLLDFLFLWLTFGSLWRTFGSLWLTFGSLCLPFGSLLRPFGSLWLSPGLIFHIFIYLLRKCRAKSFFTFFNVFFN